MPFPATLIQIHYHDRPGGVTRVMQEYSLAFKRCSRHPKARSLVVCHTKGTAQSWQTCDNVVNSKLFDYRAFRSSKSFERVRNGCRNLLERLLENPALPRPIAVVAHNLSLAKNVALSAAFAELARQRIHDFDTVFVSVIHDLAEEGRAACLHQIHLLETLSIKPWQHLYPLDHGVGFITLNERNRRLLKGKGVAVTCLPNPVRMPDGRIGLSPQVRSHWKQALQKQARQQGASFDPLSRTWLYPVRLIHRKNVLEAVLAVCCGLGENLLIGGPGTSPHDRKLFDRLVEMQRRYRLPLIMDVDKAAAFLPKPSAPDVIWADLNRFADVSISTSLAEGFGFGLHEPWLFGKIVVGRRPLGFTSPAQSYLRPWYKTLPVPIDWVGRDRLLRKYSDRMNILFGSWLERGVSPESVAEELIHDQMIDFGACDTQAQWMILDRTLRDSSFLPWCRSSGNLLIRQIEHFGTVRRDGLTDSQRIGRLIEHSCDVKSFDRGFIKVLNRKITVEGKKSLSPGHPTHFCGYFGIPGRFRINFS